MDAYEYASRSYVVDTYEYASRVELLLLITFWKIVLLHFYLVRTYEYASRSYIVDTYEYAFRVVLLLFITFWKNVLLHFPPIYHLSVTPYLELARREYPDHRTPR